MEHMAEIPYDEETSRDWTWYAVDDAGNVAEFATGGFRRLPASVRSDWQRAEQLIEYFDSASQTGAFSIRPDFESSEIVTNDPAIFRASGSPPSRTASLRASSVLPSLR